MRIVALAGGVGAARFLSGLIQVVDPASVTIIGNTGDDIELHGLHISPDLDIVVYTLAEVVDPVKGWGIRGDTFYCLRALESLGHEAWFRLGDRDLATHIHRSHLLKQGYTLSQATDRIAQAFGLRSRLLPMSDDPLATMVKMEDGWVHFEEYLVRRRTMGVILEVCLEGAERARPAPGVLEAIEAADLVVICPSNPIVSIGSILAVPGIRPALEAARATVVAVSPIVGGAPIKGPADKLMAALGHEVSALGVARLYHDLADVLVIDAVDASLSEEIAALGLRVLSTDAVMKDAQAKRALAAAVLSAAGLSVGKRG